MSQVLLATYPNNNNHYALLFEGIDDQVTFVAQILDPNNDFTFECWVRFNANAELPAFASDQAADQYFIILNRVTGNNGLCFQYDRGGGAQFLVGSSTPVPQNAWHHIAVTRSGDDWSFYQDGVLLGMTSHTPTGAITTTGAQTFAKYSSLYLNGGMDEVRIWTVARTAPEILANLYTTLVPADEPDLYGYWRFEEGSGTTATDLTSNNNDGTLVDGPVYSASDKPY